MLRTPVRDNRLMSSIFVLSGIDLFSFCSPSRGPTSTMRTSSACRLVLVESDLLAGWRCAILAHLLKDLIMALRTSRTRLLALY